MNLEDAPTEDFKQQQQDYAMRFVEKNEGLVNVVRKAQEMQKKMIELIKLYNSIQNELAICENLKNTYENFLTLNNINHKTGEIITQGGKKKRTKKRKQKKRRKIRKKIKSHKR